MASKHDQLLVGETCYRPWVKWQHYFGVRIRSRNRPARPSIRTAV